MCLITNLFVSHAIRKCLVSQELIDLFANLLIYFDFHFNFLNADTLGIHILLNLWSILNLNY